MKKTLLFFTFFCSFYAFSQVQIGTDIVGENVNDRFGRSVSLSADGEMIAVGANLNDGNSNASGHVRVFRNNNGSWEQIGNDIDGLINSSQAGLSVSLSSDGTVVAFGGPFYDIFNPNNGQTSQSHGSARIYRNVNDNWQQIGADIIGANSDDNLGLSVSLSSDGTIVAISSPGFSNSKGKVSVYRNVNDSWQQIGTDIVGDFNNDRAGISTSLSSDGSVVAIGIHSSNSNGTRSGQVKVFQNINDSWQQMGGSINGVEAHSNTGISVSLTPNGQELAVGSSYDDVDASSTLGSVRVYSFTNNNWVQKGNTINGRNANEYIGNRVRISSDGSIVAISSPISPWNPSNSIGENGLVRIYRYNANLWSQIGTDITGSAVSQELGAGLSLSSNGDKVAIGSPGGPFYTGANQEGFVRVFSLDAVLSTTTIETHEFDIFPNPTNNQFTVQLKNGTNFQRVKIYNQLSQLVKVSTTETTNIQELSSGLYFVEVITDQGKAIEKLIIE